MARRVLPDGRDATMRGNAAWAAAVAVLAFAVLHAVRGGPHAHAAATARIVWATALLAAGVALRRASERAAAAILGAACVVSVAALAVVTWAEYGGAGSPLGYLVCAPLFVVVLVPGRAGVVGVSAAASVAAVASVAAIEREPVGTLVDLAVRAVAAGAFALLGCHVHARLVRAAEVAGAARARALAELAETGQRAAGLAHDMSSPLAAIRGNLDFVREALAGAAEGADLAEIRAAIAETRGAAERLASDVAALRGAGQRARAAAPTAAQPASARPGERQGGPAGE